jgi:hypothetical protein
VLALAVDFLAVDFFAGVFAVVLRLAVDVRAALVFFAVDLFAVALLAVDLFAGDFLAGDFFAGDFLAVDFFAGDFLAVDFFAGDFLAVDFFAGDLLAGLAFFVVLVPVARDGVELRTVSAVTFGAFFAPETMALSSVPARNRGTLVFLARTRSPVAGLRTMRAGRVTRSKAPNPVMATFWPLATSRVTVATTESSACAAARRLPSK